MWFLIGSRAIENITTDFYRDLEKSDMDLYCTKEDFQEFLKTTTLLEKCFPLKKDKYRLKIKGYPIIELKIYNNDSVYAWLAEKSQQELLSNKKYDLDCVSVSIPNLQCLSAIKQSHLYWPINWVKNVEDFHWLKEKTQQLPFTTKQLEFKRKIKTEMKKLHGKIPYGKLKQLPGNYHEMIQQCSPLEYDKKVIYFVHEKLSLKQKLKVINNFNQYSFLFIPPIKHNKKPI